jgi:hypothetical protein
LIAAFLALQSESLVTPLVGVFNDSETQLLRAVIKPIRNNTDNHPLHTSSSSDSTCFLAKSTKCIRQHFFPAGKTFRLGIRFLFPVVSFLFLVSSQPSGVSADSKMFGKIPI